jgi:hypothetical protein
LLATEKKMETLTLTLHKSKSTKNKVVYGTQDGSVIQSVYIDRESLGDEPPESIKVVLSAG